MRSVLRIWHGNGGKCGPHNTIGIVMFTKSENAFTIAVDFDNHRKLYVDLHKSMHDFHARYCMVNTKIEPCCFRNVISISKDRTLTLNGQSFDMFWMENLNDKNLQEAVNAIDGHCIRNVKIFNDCADGTVDFAKMMHANLEATIAINIISKGPITVNANVSSYR